MATAIATRGDDRYLVLRQQLDKRADDFKSALPAHITPEKFQRTILTAVQSNPDLLRADRGSLITSAMKAAQDGLLPDGREAAIVTFNTRKKIDGQWESVTLAQYMPMAFGLRKKILQSGEISALETNVVYRREVEEGAFIFEAGTEATLRHRPMLDLADDDLADENIVAAYSVAIMKDGSKSFEVMRRAEINKVRQASQTGAVGKTTRDGKAITPKGPWVDWFGEMARKTVMRRHSKTLPMSGDLLDVEATDEVLLARSAMRTLGADTGESEPAAIPPTRTETAALVHDPDTGEIVDDQTLADLDRQGLREMDGGDLFREGRDDPEMDEAHTDVTPEDHPAWGHVAKITRKIDRCGDIDAIGAVEAEHRGDIEAMPGDARQALMDRKQRRIGEIMGARS